MPAHQSHFLEVESRPWNLEHNWFRVDLGRKTLQESLLLFLELKPLQVVLDEISKGGIDPETTAE